MMRYNFKHIEDKSDELDCTYTLYIMSNTVFDCIQVFLLCIQSMCCSRNEQSHAWRLVSDGSCTCGGVDHSVEIFECDKHFCIVHVSHIGFMNCISVTTFFCNIFNVVYNFHISSFSFIYAEVDIEVYWLLRCVVRLIGRLLLTFPNSIQIQILISIVNNKYKFIQKLTSFKV